MARPKNPVPAYKKHPDCNQARCWVAGRWVYLGEYNSPASLEAYRRVCAEVAATSAPAVAAARAPGRAVSVNELLLAFLDHVEGYYVRPDGTRTNEVSEYRQALRVVRRLYGTTPASEFGPLALKAVQTEMAVGLGWCRSRVNKQVGRVRRCWAWGVGVELVPETVARALGYVTGLRKKRSIARETPPVRPVPDAAYEATLPELAPTVRTMVQLQRVAGLRPGEVRLLVPADLDRTGDIWVYAPAEHKMAHLGRDKAVPLPPSARALLESRLEGKRPDEYVFTPRQAREEMYAARREKRVSKVTPSQINRRKPAHQLRKKWTARFSAYSYAQWVARGCDRAFPPTGDLARRPKESAAKWWARLTDDQRRRVKEWRKAHRWQPNQLRHAFGTEVRERFGLEVAQVLLGHKNARVTEVYAEAALRKGIEAAREIG